MHRSRARIGTLLVLVLAAPTMAADAEIPISTDEAWRRAITALAADNATVTLSDEKTGIIQATHALPLEAGRRCMKLGGRLDKVESRVTITMKAISPTVTYVSVSATTQSTWYRYRKFVFIRTGRDYDYPACPAPDRETDLLQRIRR